MKAHLQLAGALLALFCCFSLTAAAAPTFPTLTGRIVDDANILSEQTKLTLTSRLADLESRTHNQIVVVTLPSLQGYEIEDYGYQLGRTWGIGHRGANNGALLIVAPAERKVRIEVGYGLEGVLTDAWCSVLLQRQVLPKFRRGDYDGGVLAAADAIIAQLSLPPDQAALQASTTKASSSPSPQDWLFGLFVLTIFFGLLFLVFLNGLSSDARFGTWSSGRTWGGGWSSGGFGGYGGGGGGGFSGGGGSFGGGGASGSW